MIPKKIHYCWFGGNKKPKEIEKCIKSWGEKCPDFEIIEWNENNFDINISNFTKKAYKQKKWAYVADYARFYILVIEGGIYLDTDMLLFKNLDNFLNNDFFLGIGEHHENKFIRIYAGIIGMSKNNPIGKNFIDYYNNIKGNIIVDRKYVIPDIIEKVLENYNIKNKDIYQKLNENIVLYPIEYFYIENKKNRTNNTYAIHLGAGSWMTFKERISKIIIRKILILLENLKIKNLIKKIYRIIKKLGKY